MFSKFIIFEELRRSYQIFRDFLATLHTKMKNISNLHKNQQKIGENSMPADVACRLLFTRKNKNSFTIIIQIFTNFNLEFEK